MHIAVFNLSRPDIHMHGDPILGLPQQLILEELCDYVCSG